MGKTEKKIDFLIFYEVINREFESITLLKHELVKRGYSVEFFSFGEYNNRKKRDALFDNVKIVVMPSLYHDEEILTFVYGVAGKVKNIVNLRWEQLFSKQTEENMDYYVYPKGNAMFAYHCCWGERPQKKLLQAGVNPKLVFIGGPIHMDFLRSDLKKIYLSREELFEKYGINKEKKCILFISSFSLSTMNKWAIKAFFSQYDENEIQHVKGRFSREIQSRLIISGWLMELAGIKDCTIIYRPHPTECNTETLDCLKGTDNIKVIGDENIKQWVLACDQVYTWNSTSVVEASIAGIPCAVLRPVKFHDGEDMAIYEDYPFITSFQQLCDYYEHTVDSSLFVNSEVVKAYYKIDEGEPSYMRTADILERALRDDYTFPWNNYSDQSLKEVRKNLKKQDVQDIFAAIIVKPFYRLYPINKIIARIFPKLNGRFYNHNSQKGVISEESFDEMEKRLSFALIRE